MDATFKLSTFPIPFEQHCGVKPVLSRFNVDPNNVVSVRPVTAEEAKLFATNQTREAVYAGPNTRSVIVLRESDGTTTELFSTDTLFPKIGKVSASDLPQLKPTERLAIALVYGNAAETLLARGDLNGYVLPASRQFHRQEPTTSTLG